MSNNQVLVQSVKRIFVILDNHLIALSLTDRHRINLKQIALNFLEMIDTAGCLESLQTVLSISLFDKLRLQQGTFLISLQKWWLTNFLKDLTSNLTLNLFFKLVLIEVDALKAFQQRMLFILYSNLHKPCIFIDRPSIFPTNFHRWVSWVLLDWSVVSLPQLRPRVSFGLSLRVNRRLRNPNVCQSSFKIDCAVLLHNAVHLLVQLSFRPSFVLLLLAICPSHLTCLVLLLNSNFVINFIERSGFVTDGFGADKFEIDHLCAHWFGNACRRLYTFLTALVRFDNGLFFC